MKRLVTLTLAAALAITCACAPQKKTPVDYIPSGGSRADATVEMGAIYDPRFEYPATTQEDMRKTAIQRCQAWGYTDAQPFGKPMSRCLQQIQGAFYTMICTQAEARQVFQCLGRGNSQVK